MGVVVADLGIKPYLFEGGDDLFCLLFWSAYLVCSQPLDNNLLNRESGIE